MIYLVAQALDIEATTGRHAQSLEGFLGAVSRELRAPLTSILGHAELLRDFESEALSEQGRRFLEVIERDARRELRLLSNLLALSQIEAGSFRIEASRIDVGAIAAAVVQAAAVLAADAGVVLELDAEPVPAAFADPERIAAVIDHLVSNAIRFTPRGGRVDVRVAGTGEAIAIEVADTGIGIPADEQARIFDRLFRAETAEDLQISGSGLGLTVVKAIVDAHEAAISLSSEVGRGSTFRVELPLRRHAA